MRRFRYHLSLLFVLTSLLVPSAIRAEGEPVIHAILFYSPTCPHCQEVIQNGLPPIMAQYGDQVQIIAVDVSTPGGQQFYFAVADWVEIPAEMSGVPLMVVGGELLYGSVDIPANLPGIVAAGLERGGIPWPDIPIMDTVLAQIEEQRSASTGEGPETAPAQTDGAGQASDVSANNDLTRDEQTLPAPGKVGEITDIATATPTESESQSPFARLMANDPVGGAIALILMAFMIGAVVFVMIKWLRSGFPEEEAAGWQNWLIPILSLLGIGIAAYMTLVETTNTTAVCGPVGDCNAVQGSTYSRLFGILPIGVLGLLGYGFILILWLWQRLGPIETTDLTIWILPVVTLFGIMLSIYLTYLELYVIGAVCLWCVSSAVVMTILFLSANLWLVGGSDSQMLPPEQPHVSV